MFTPLMNSAFMGHLIHNNGKSFLLAAGCVPLTTKGPRNCGTRLVEVVCRRMSHEDARSWLRGESVRMNTCVEWWTEIIPVMYDCASA